MSPWHLSQAARIIDQGGIIAYPTEAVYGLGCDPLNANAVMSLLELKQRPMEKGLILIAANIEQLYPFMAPINDKQLSTLETSWPGPVTWLVPANQHTPVWLTGCHDTIAVRVTTHPIATKLCQTIGHALVSTSANRSGKQPAKSPLQVRKYFPDAGSPNLDKIVVGSLGHEARPSTIKDLATGKIIRPS